MALGDEAVDPVMDAIAKEKGAEQPRQAFLVGILASLHSAHSNKGLVAVLDDPRPLVRANAASALGRNHEGCAVPRLLRLLGDEAEYGKQVSTDPHTEKALTVRMAVSKALESIIGVHSDASLRTDAQRWWNKNKGTLDCRDWN